MSGNIDDYIQKGIYGPKETKPDERRKFLGTTREQIVIVLTQEQVREKGIYSQVEDAIKENRKALLLLNGNIHYKVLLKYTKIASKYNVPYRYVTNKNHTTEIGLVLKHDYAVNKDEIFVKKEVVAEEPQQSNNKGLLSKLARLFKTDS
ncbi:YueI family protein [Sporosarcina sp. ACRSL]|uniref:YueI family protein n=1 Tax=Sporosarcina sp. ACRSL TaxID=2918215 RepID=UPI001EF50BF8|nr:YueI family protein [Sporosarcina sp. ACRSL]MCG7345693.1 YueI family protein [Sporosarcina sp. ACRSL]